MHNNLMCHKTLKFEKSYECPTLTSVLMLIFITTSLCAQLEKLFRPGGRDETLTEVIRSLTELNLMREKIQEMEGLGQHTSVLVTLFSHAADDACQYVSQIKMSMNTHGGGGRTRGTCYGDMTMILVPGSIM